MHMTLKRTKLISWALAFTLIKNRQWYENKKSSRN